VRIPSRCSTAARADNRPNSCAPRGARRPIDRASRRPPYPRAAAAGITLDSTAKPKGGKSRGQMLLEAAGVQLPQTHTPQPKSGKKRLISGELTPASKQAAAELPPGLAILRDMLEAVQACGNMLRLRGKQATFDALTQPVETYCGRRFRTEYLRQIKQLHPDAFQWRHIMATGKGGRCVLLPLLPLLLLPRPGTAPAPAASCIPSLLLGAHRLRPCTLAGWSSSCWCSRARERTGGRQTCTTGMRCWRP
jgi:hypothetical protein